ncbi:hypothetical protein Tco_1030536 [Tanacetum coccineum]|uniref:Reverse transcriptase domain-containing protein n=1 Tax=Tanacetum coccineum TaxID=301880 RepID=A0ABQ5G7Y2_9ASTR
MDFSVISISSNSSEESVGTSTARVILFGTIPTTIPSTAPTTDLPVIHDDTPLVPTDTPTIPNIPSIAPTIQYTSPFIDTNASDSDTPNTPPSQDPYEVTVARWRSRPNGVLKMLTARKSVGSLPTHRLSLRYSADYFSLDSHSNTSSYSSSRHSPSGYALSDSHCDSLTATSAGPSRKRYRSPTSFVPVVSLVYGALSPVRIDLLPPHKRIRDSDSVTDFEVSLEDGFMQYVPREVGLGVDVKYSFEHYTEPDVDSDIQADINACIAFADDLRARGTDGRVVVETTAEEEVESSTRGTTEVAVDPMVRPVIDDDDVRETVRKDVPDHVTASVLKGSRRTKAQRAYRALRRGADQCIALFHPTFKEISSYPRPHRDDYFCGCITMSAATHTGMTQDVINELIAKRVEEAQKAYDTAKNLIIKTEIENEQQDDNVDANGNNGNSNRNGNGNPNENNGGVVPIAQESTYQDFVKCQPLNFKGTEGVVGLTRWFKKMKTVYHISNCPPRYQVKYATCTLLDGALTWWNSHKRTVGVDDAYAMTWKALMKLMTERFQELTLLCTKMVSELEDKVEKYIGGLLDSIQENVIVVEPVRL